MDSIVYFENIEKQLLDEIEKSKNEILIVVAWITNNSLFKNLLTALDNNVHITILTRNDYVNNSQKSLMWKEFINKVCKLYFFDKPNSLHHKFVVFDSEIVYTGSYNWTNQAEKLNKENIISSKKTETIQSFKKEVIKLISESFVPKENELNVIAPITANIEEINMANYEFDSLDAIQKALLKYLNKDYLESTEILTGLDSEIYEKYNLLSWNYLRMKLFDEGINCAKKAISLNPYFPDNFNVLGANYFEANNIKEAINSYNKAIELEPQATTYNLNLLILYDRIGLNSQGDKENNIIIKKASNIIKNPNNFDNYILFKAYLDRGLSRYKYKDLRDRDLLRAKEIFNTKLKDIEKDYHDYDLIEENLNQ
ncbi:MAG: phospholipase D-like domain-containing protein [Chitinophagales bacterium]